MSNEYLDIAIEKVVKQEINKVLGQIRDEIESHIVDTNGLDFNSALYIASEIINNYIKEQTE